MTEHLPECPHSEPALSPGFLVMCICDRLRACEQRVWKQPLLVVSRRAGWNDALIAAREAIETAFWDALEALDPLDPQTITLALNAIDALREKP